VNIFCLLFKSLGNAAGNSSRDLHKNQFPLKSISTGGGIEGRKQGSFKLKNMETKRHMGHTITSI
jgi:hypothetical protein